MAEWIDQFVDWLKNASFLFSFLRKGIESIVDWIAVILSFPNAIVLIIIVTLLAYIINGRKWGLTFFVLIGLLLIHNLGYWDDMIYTLSLVITSSLIAVILGVPLGIWMAKSNIMVMILRPLLDLMQTLPAFVYLIPAVAFFGIGMVPGVVASVIFSMPPTVRLTNLGIRQVSDELVEAADAFGSTASQKLFKVELPMAKGTIMAGVNQSIMLALSMVVIAAMIGAKGLGQKVYYALGQNNVGAGFESGIAIVILAIILDRITQNLDKKKSAND